MSKRYCEIVFSLIARVFSQPIKDYHNTFVQGPSYTEEVVEFLWYTTFKELQLITPNKPCM